MRKPGPLTVDTVQGEPIVVGGKELTPVARIISFEKGGAAGEENAASQGGFIRIEPIAVLETAPAGTRRIPLHDETRRALTGILVAALPIVLEIAMKFIERLRRSFP